MFTLSIKALCSSVVAVALMVATFAMPAPSQAGSQVDIYTTAYRAGTFNQLVNAAGLTGLDETLKGAGPLTVFAPSDAAFGKLPSGALYKLLQPENKTLLKELVAYHVVPGAYPSERLLKPRAKVYTIPGSGGPLEMNIRGEKMKVWDATVIRPDVAASNGIIHVINKVLIPKNVARALEQLRS